MKTLEIVSSNIVFTSITANTKFRWLGHVPTLRCKFDGLTIMPGFVDNKGNEYGVSLLELSMVVILGLLVTAVGLPRMNNVIANTRLRASMTSVSGLLQNTRMAAVQQNRIMTAKYVNLASPPYSLI